jgi:hypothetical protein
MVRAAITVRLAIASPSRRFDRTAIARPAFALMLGYQARSLITML